MRPKPWPLVVFFLVTTALSVKADMLERFFSSYLGSPSLETGTVDTTEPFTTAHYSSTDIYHQQEESPFDDDGSNDNTAANLSENENEGPPSHQTESTVPGGEKTDEHFKNLHNPNVSDDESTTNLDATTTAVALSSSSPGASAKRTAGDVVEAAFPSSREPESKEESGPRGFGQWIAYLIARWGPEQKFKSVVQILFFHIYIISFFYLFVVLHQGVLGVIDLLRTPLLIYKEVDDYEEVKGYPAPKLPPLHKDYGYTGGFKTPKGEEIKYIPYPSHGKDHPEPMESPTPEELSVDHEQMDPDEHHEEPQAYHHPHPGNPHNKPPSGAFPPHHHNAVLGRPPAAGDEETSSYVSYAGEKL